MLVYNFDMYALIFTVLSFLLSLISMPIIIKFCNNLKIFDYQDERKIHNGNISRLGGIGIVIPFFICSFLFLYLEKSASIYYHLPLLISGFIIFFLALLDDFINLPAIIKLLGQIIASVIVVLNNTRFTQIFGWQLPTPISYIITFVWIVGLINAYNLIDGLDGLCGSLAFTSLTTIGTIFALNNNHTSVICFILAASILGFLCFNWPPAKLFMGDNGSQFLGFIIAIMPLYNNLQEFEYNKFLIMIVLTSLPLFDMIAAIWRRLRDKKPVMAADHSHLHHKLLNLEYTKKQVLYLILSLQILLCVSVIISFFLDIPKGLAVLIETGSLSLLFFCLIHFSNRKYIKTHNVN